MLAALKNTLAQLNVETRQGSAAVARVLPAPAPEASGAAQEKTAPARVDAVTGGTQPIALYFAGQMPPRKKDPDSD
ncbi:MAG: hypothetical protein FJ119_10295 [Deltaproteobacteria bacterium]|nr:hypothetical protein [Deltaproteobacteria bacterium]